MDRMKETAIFREGRAPASPIISRRRSAPPSRVSQPHTRRLPRSGFSVARKSNYLAGTAEEIKRAKSAFKATREGVLRYIIWPAS
jgi:hypothetical protein